MSKFQRADGYSEGTLREIRQMLSKCNGHAIVIPSTDSAIFYYQGKPFLSVDSSKGKWERFGEDYNKHFEDESSGIKGQKNPAEILRNLSNKSNTNEDIKQIYMDNLDTILECIGKGLPSDKERASQQVIALNNIVFSDNSYCICGFEAAIPKDDFNDNKKPEIDLIAVNVKKKEILLIEYKCQRDALLKSTKEHCEDYLAILGNIELCDVLKREIIKAYMMMRKIYGASDLELSHKEFQINIAFLITKYPCEEKRKVGDKPLGDSDLDNAKAKLEECVEGEEELKKRIKYLICDEPEKCRLEGWKYLDEWGK